TVYKCYEAGASIAHVHTFYLIDHPEEWAKTVQLIRDKCDIIVQAGMSSIPAEGRTEMFEAKPDMMSIILNHHDEAFPSGDIYRIHTREELELYANKCRKYNVKPEFEIWHAGSIWNLNYLIKKNLLDKPYFLTLFFDWPGGTWSPATSQEFLARLAVIPPGCIYQVSVMSPEQPKLAALSIIHGGHVRTGTEDYPYVYKNVLAKHNAELVAKIRNLGKELDRDIADPSTARRILNIRSK
ncbi:MAG: 3-keto-5-aminohexanoate cleavage protein, partial [Crenarchaeota archaeon]|nr:3-keto-5-aminohexanoate cleavage protein [Thermoproteota archaeon]